MEPEVSTTARSFYISWARWIQYTPPPPILLFQAYFNIILPYMPTSSKQSPHQNFIHICALTTPIHTTTPAHFNPWFSDQHKAEDRHYAIFPIAVIGRNS
jgi:hypothetical protein